MVKKLIYKRLRLLFTLGILSTLWNCKSNDIAVDKKYTTDITTLEMLLEKESYDIDIEVAFPFTTGATTQIVNALLVQNTGNNAGRIDVRSDDNFIVIQGDSVKGNLSFFGERRLSGGRHAGTDGSIHFEGIPKDYKKTINKRKKKLEINFNTSQYGGSSESYEVYLEIFPNKRVEVKIASTLRTFMRYSGTLKPVKNKAE